MLVKCCRWGTESAKACSFLDGAFYSLSIPWSRPKRNLACSIQIRGNSWLGRRQVPERPKSVQQASTDQGGLPLTFFGELGPKCKCFYSKPSFVSARPVSSDLVFLILIYDILSLPSLLQKIGLEHLSFNCLENLSHSKWIYSRVSFIAISELESGMGFEPVTFTFICWCSNSYLQQDNLMIC